MESWRTVETISLRAQWSVAVSCGRRTQISSAARTTTIAPGLAPQASTSTTKAKQPRVSGRRNPSRGNPEAPCTLEEPLRPAT